MNNWIYVKYSKAHQPVTRGWLNLGLVHEIPHDEVKQVDNKGNETLVHENISFMIDGDLIHIHEDSMHTLKIHLNRK